MQVLGPQSPQADLSQGCFVLASCILTTSARVHLTFTTGLGQHPSLGFLEAPPARKMKCRGGQKWAGRGGGGDQTQRGTCCQNPAGVTLVGGFTLLNLHLHPYVGAETAFHSEGRRVCLGLSTVTSGSRHTCWHVHGLSPLDRQP